MATSLSGGKSSKCNLLCLKAVATFPSCGFCENWIISAICCHLLHVSVLTGTPNCDEFTPASPADFTHSGDRAVFEIPSECCTN